MPSIWVSDEDYEALIGIKADLEKYHKRPASFSDVVSHLMGKKRMEGKSRKVMKNTRRNIRAKALTTAISALMLISLISVFQAGIVSALEAPDYQSAIVKAADNLLATQNKDGGWEWENPDDNSLTGVPSPPNTRGVTAQGLLDAYKLTRKSEYLDACIETYEGMVVLSGNPDPAKHRIRGPDIPFLVELSYFKDNLAYANFAKARYENAIEETGGGTATGLAENIRDVRKGQGYPSLISWDINLYIQGALALHRCYPGEGYDTQASDMAEVIYDSLYVAPVDFDLENENQAEYWLAYTGAIEAFATTGTHTDELPELKAPLLSSQQPDGYFVGVGGGSDVQTTAYAVMALLKAGEISTAIENGVNYLMNEQLSTGGYQYDSTGNTEVTSEAAQALFDTIQAVGTVRNDDTEIHYITIQSAIDAASPGDTVLVGPGTYEEGQITISSDIFIVGNSTEKPVIRPTTDLTGDGPSDAWFLVDSGVSFDLSNVVMDGGEFFVYQAIRSHGFTNINNVDFRNIQGSVSGSPYRGIAISSFGGTVLGGAGSDSHGGGGSPSHLVVTESTFEQIGRIGVLVKGTESTAEIVGCTYTGKGTGDWLDYAFEAGGGGEITVEGCTITNCTGVASVDGSTSAGILVTTYYGSGTQANISGNDIYGNTEGIAVGYDEADTSVVVAHNNNIVGNISCGVGSTAPLVDATLNWWGNPTGPRDPTTNPSATGDSVSGNVNYTPWLDASYPGGNARSWNVQNVDTGDNFNSIQAAIDAASPDDTVIVGPGTYEEQVVINKNLTLEGEDGAKIVAPTTLESYKIAESSKVWEPIFFVYGGTMDESNLVTGSETIEFQMSGFEIDGTDHITSNRFAGILARNVEGTLSNNEIYNLAPDSNKETFGIVVYGDSEVTISNNIVRDFTRGGIGANGDLGGAPDPEIVIEQNTITRSGISPTWAPNGIQVGFGATGVIRNNCVSWSRVDDPDWDATGILVFASSEVEVIGNVIDNSDAAIAVAGWGPNWGGAASDARVENNIVTDSDYGISIEDNVRDVLIRNNVVEGNVEYGIQIVDYDDSSFPGTPEDIQIRYNNILNNAVQVRDNAEVLDILNVVTNNTFDRAVIVETASYLPFIWSSIQDAIDNASAGDTVLVYPGTYAEEITIAKANLTLQSESKWGAIIRPPITPANHGAAIYISADGVTVDGFEIDGSTVCNNGIYGWETSDLTIKNNKIHGAVNAWDGCGILLISWGNSGTVYNNLIENNVIYDTGRMGIMVMDHGGPTLPDGGPYTVTSGNIITGNTVYDVWKVAWGDHGGGIQINVAKNCSITNNEVYNVQNGQRGIYIFGSAAGNIITYNTLRDNPISIQLWISGEGGTTINWDGDTPASPQVRYNNIYNNGSGAVSSNIAGTPMVMDATLNWWGDPSGPGGVGLGTGDNVSVNVNYASWLSRPLPTISGISVSGVTTTSATITWTTALPADSRVEYGPIIAYGLTSSIPDLTTSHSLGLTGLTPSTTYHFRVRSEDAYGHVDDSGDLTFITATPLPPSPPPTTLIVDTAPIKANVYVDGSLWGVAPRTRSLAAGTYTIYFGDVLGYLNPAPEVVTLAAGETRTVTGVYTEIPPENIENQSPTYDIPSITPEENATIPVENTALTEITIQVENAAENVKITVQEVTEGAAGIAIGAPGATYKYLSIVAENITDAQIGSVVIRFKVEKSWIIANDIDIETITLNRYDPLTGEWTSLPTTYLSEDDTYVYFSAISPGLSIFGVSGSTIIPANFELSNLVITPSEVSAGETVTISVVVNNAGGRTGSTTVTLEMNGVAVDTRSVTLDAGNSTTVTFTLSEDVTGTYTINVAGLTGSFVVTTPPAPSIVPLGVTIIIIVLAIGIVMWRWRIR